MRLYRFVHACVAAGALVMGASANAHPAPRPAPGEYPMRDRDGSPPASDMRPEWRERPAPAFAPDPRERAGWIDECYDRMTWSYEDDGYSRRGRRHRERLARARVSCERYYDDYYAAYAPPLVMTVPAPATVECPVVVEDEYADVPAPRVIRRAPRRAPAQRERIVPDKRIRSS